MINPVIEEAMTLHFRTREFLSLHGFYLAALAFATVVVWPSRGFMEFFKTQTVPASFEAIAIFQVIVLSIISMYVGMDRIAGTRIIRYSEWLEHTTLPVGTLLVGKVAGALLHTVVLIGFGTPFLFIAAGPAGIPPRAVLSAEWVIFLVALFTRTVGMGISLFGEKSDVVRITGNWLFLALLYLATIQVLQPLNPIIAVVRQQNEQSLLVTTILPVPIAAHPAVPSTICFLTGTLVTLLALAVAMHHHRGRTGRRLIDG